MNATNLIESFSAKKKRHFYEQQIGSTRDVIFEGENKDGFMYGFTAEKFKVSA
ncbi:hypothetical protein N9Y89_02100 [bacterium]|nr:hypothetical protein [bacterium]